MGKGSALRRAVLLSRRRFLQNLSLLAGAWPFVKVPLLRASSPASPFAFEEIPAVEQWHQMGAHSGQVARKSICRKPAGQAALSSITTMTAGWTFIWSTAGNAIFTTRPQPLRNALYRNNRDGTFTDVTEKAGRGRRRVRHGRGRRRLRRRRLPRLSTSRSTDAASSITTTATGRSPM